MENNLDDVNWEKLINTLRDLITGIAEQKGLVEEQRAIIDDKIFKQLESITIISADAIVLLMVGVIMVGWLKVGLLPSELPNELNITATFFRYYPESKASDAPEPGGESHFWDGLFCIGIDDFITAKASFALCLSDDYLPHWMRVIVLQFEIWHFVRSDEYELAYETLDLLRESLYINDPMVDYIIGYIKALEDNNIGSSYDEMVFITPAISENPELMTGDIVVAGSPSAGVSFTKSALASLQNNISEKIVTELRLGLWQMKEEIVSSIPLTGTLEEVCQKLRNEHGNWVDKLANQGALTNAEFLYESLSRRSWGEVVLGYTNAVEAEVRARLIQPLEVFLMKRSDGKLVAIGQTFIEVKSQKLSLSDCEQILRGVGSSKSLQEFFSLLPNEARLFVLNTLPDRLSELRNLRNPSAHGSIVANAKEARKIVIGTPEKPGILKLLSEINILGNVS